MMEEQKFLASLVPGLTARLQAFLFPAMNSRALRSNGFFIFREEK